MSAHATLGCVGAAFALLLAAAGVATAAEEVVKHSGVIVDFDPSSDTIVLAEVGPWRVQQGATVVTRQRIKLMPRTEFRIAFRTEPTDGGFPGQFVEAPIDRGGVYVEDWVTVECRHEGSRMIALSITILDLPASSHTPDSDR